MFKNIQRCSKIFKDVQTCSKMFKHVQRCSKMFKDIQKCTKMSKNIRRYSKIPNQELDDKNSLFPCFISRLVRTINDFNNSLSLILKQIRVKSASLPG